MVFCVTANMCFENLNKPYGHTCRVKQLARSQEEVGYRYDTERIFHSLEIKANNSHILP